MDENVIHPPIRVKVNVPDPTGQRDQEAAKIEEYLNWIHENPAVIQEAFDFVRDFMQGGSGE